MDDFVSLVDTLLLLDTLMLGFLIALLTQSSAGKSDLLERDGFNFRTVLADNNIHEEVVKINSHYILVYGQFGVCCFFLSIACGVGTYLNLNFSRSREDDEILSRFSKYFLPFIIVGYGAFMGGLIFFFVSFQAILEVVFPAYCSPHLDQPVEDVAPLFRGIEVTPDTNGMHEIHPDEWEACIHESLTVRSRWNTLYPTVGEWGFWRSGVASSAKRRRHH